MFILAIAYLITFGSKLAVLSMLPMFFFKTFRASQNLSMPDAGLLASSFVITNIIARPLGGMLSDRYRPQTGLIPVYGGSGHRLFIDGHDFARLVDSP